MQVETLDSIYLDREDNIQCTISRFGATITSWVVRGVEQLFVSRKAVYDNLKATRGGIMLIFPKYRDWLLGPTDGFANLMVWKILKGPFRLPTHDIQVILELEDGQIDNHIWHFAYKVQYKITLLEKGLHLDFRVINLSTYSFYFNFLFSNHIRVPDIRKCKIRGLKESKFIDKKNDIYLRQENDDEIQIKNEYSKVFIETDDNVNVSGVMDDKVIYLTKSNLPDVILESPWKEKAKEREDFCHDEWKKILILEVGHKNFPIRLFPNEIFSAHLEFKVKAEDEEEEEIIQFY